MSINVLTDYNFNKNQLINPVIDNREQNAISTPREGQIVFDPTLKRLMYYNGTDWEGADAIDSISKIKGTDIVNHINNASTTSTINNNRLANSGITLGTTGISLGGTITDVQGLTINKITLTEQSTGFSIEGGTSKRKLTINDKFISDTNTLTIGSGKTITTYANLVFGTALNKGDIFITSNDTTARTLTLSNSIELAGTGTKLTIDGTPTISGGGKITVPTDSNIVLKGNSTTERTLTLGGNVTLFGTSSATLNAALTIGTPSTNVGGVTLRSSGANNTTITSTGDVKLVAGTMVNTVDARLHDQNTDSGTSNLTFQINTANGVVLQSANILGTNLELQLINPGNDDYASIRVKDLYVEGTTTSINSNEVQIGDNEIVLNSDVTSAGPNGADGGVAIKRFSKGIEKHARLTFTEVTGKWSTTNIMPETGIEVVAPITNKVVATFGDSTATTFTIPHNLNTRDVTVTIRETGTPYGLVFADVDFSLLNSIKITVSSNNIPSNDQYTATIIG